MDLTRIALWDGLLCNFFGFVIVGCLMALNGRAGSVYHVSPLDYQSIPPADLQISFPVFSRSSFGVYGALWPVFNRALSACVWNGVDSVTGGQCIYVMLHSIFPSIANIPNKMPASSGLTSAQMICFFIYWLICIPPLTLSIRQWPILIKIKLVAYFLSCIGMLALALTASDGVGDTLTKRGSAQGSERVWLIVRFTLLATASCATFASNAADWQRNSSKPKDPILGQIFGFPMSNVRLFPR
jgi:NCS1 family nucleobase:cation symporter-1